MSENIRELESLINLYETAIERHETLLQKVLRGKYKTTQLSDEMFVALVKGDIKLMKEKKSELEDEVKELQIKAIKDSIVDSDNLASIGTDAIESSPDLNV